MLDKSYIVRIYQENAGALNGVLEDVEKNTRQAFNTSEQLWAFITRNQHVAGAINCAQRSPASVTQEPNETAPLTKLIRLIPVERSKGSMPEPEILNKLKNGAIK